jgi:hypothetical protein
MLNTWTSRITITMITCFITATSKRKGLECILLRHLKFMNLKHLNRYKTTHSTEKWNYLHTIHNGENAIRKMITRPLLVQKVCFLKLVFYLWVTFTVS